MSPPRLPSRHLVEAGALFGVSEGTIRVALTRMTQAGELSSDSGYYELAGHLLERYERQRRSRAPVRLRWAGDWSLLIVRAHSRTPEERAALRAATRVKHYGELREGVWIRPQNLPRDRDEDAWTVIADQCRSMAARPEAPADLVQELWDLPAWQAEAARLRDEMAPLTPRLLEGDVTRLAPAFEIATEVVRHVLSDPLMPAELAPAAADAGRALRDEYDEYETAFQALWRDFFAAQR